jgi:hypothetical protein
MHCLPPHVLADPFACLEHPFLSPPLSMTREFNDFVLNALPGDYGASILHYEPSESYTSSRIVLQFRRPQKQMKLLQMPPNKHPIISRC